MDDDDLRRGQPTVHKAYDESTAVLTGDALLALSFGVITRHTPSPPVSAQALLSIIQDLSDVSSVQGLVNGQYVDIQYEGKAFTQEILEYIHTYKTGALFSFSTRSGARLAGADDDTVETFSKFGQTLGLAFQIVDDLLDIEASSEQLGKTPGKDERQQKATYPSLMGLAKAREAAEQLIAEAIALLDGLQLPQERVEGLRSLSQFIGERIC
jgi:geranylgeranyl diphosphate synthase type II